MRAAAALGLAFLACAPAGSTAPGSLARPDPADGMSADDRLHLVPWPRSVRGLDGSFRLTGPVRLVVATPGERVREIATLLGEVVAERTGFEVTIAGGTTDGARATADGAVILLATGLDHDDPEAYTLRVSAGGVEIVGAGPAGLLWGVQTFRQLLPPEFEDVNAVGADAADGAGTPTRITWTIPAVDIEDAPRHAWRGSLMDVSRHFFPVEFVKRYVDLLSRYKMNVLHWHLTEDQGWRLEIEGYPRLTEVAAWRIEPDGSRHGGFYTREQVRDVVEHARLRGVRVVPEIEMPGHASAALVAYPELACADPPREVPASWGVFRDIYCVGKPATFAFLEDVLSVVAEMFPSEYVHVGGDEVPKDRWEACASCRELMRREGLADEEELQAWFLRRIQRHLHGLGRTMIGWDEILEGGGVPGAVVQVWRDPATIREAIRRGHDVIASPTSHAYFDYSPAGLPLEQVYSFDPTAGLAPEEAVHVLGGEGNLWSEYITAANFDFQAFPRILALGEVLWSGPATELRDFASFQRRLDGDQYARLRALGVRPGPESSDVVRMRVGTDPSTGEPRVGVETSVSGIEVRYTTDGSTPSLASPLLADTTTFADGDDVTIGVFAGGEPIPIRRGFSVVDHPARGRPVELVEPPDMRYPGPGPDALTDGLRGSENHRDGIWQGWWEHDLEATVDLGSARTIRAVELSFLENEGAWILPPDSVAVLLSLDGETWRPIAAMPTTGPPRDGGAAPGARAGTVRVTFLVEEADSGDRTEPPEARYVRVSAPRAPLPAGHPGAGESGWLFVDEIVVR